MKQTMKSLLSFCHSVCKHSSGRNFDSILMKFCTVIQGPKNKAELVWGKTLITTCSIFPQFLTPVMHFQWEGSSTMMMSHFA